MNVTEPNRTTPMLWMLGRLARLANDPRWRPFLQLLLFLAFAATKLSSPWDKFPRYTGDKRIWAGIAELPLFSRDFWFSTRPFTMSLFYKLVDISDERIIWLQSLMAIGSWGFFASSVSRLVSQRWIALLVFSGILAVGLTSTVHAWDIVIRTESLSSSLLMLTLGCTLRFLTLSPDHRRRRLLWLVCGLVAAFLTAFARDTNAYVLLLIAGSLPFAQWLAHGKVASGPFLPRLWWRVRRQGVLPLVFSLGLVLLSFGSQYTVRESQRYFFPLMNTIFRRVLPSNWKRKYFEHELGMPMSRALMSRRGKWASSDRRAAFNREAYADFREWLARDGLRGYQRYLLDNFEVTFAEAHRFYPRMVRARFGRVSKASQNRATELADAWLLHGPLSADPTRALVSVFVLGLFASFAARRPRTRLLALFAVLCAALAASQAYICYHGDAMEVERHALPVGMFLRLGAVAFLALSCIALHTAAARALSMLRRRRAPAPLEASA